MKPEQRLFYLKIAAGGMVAFCFIFYVIILPGIQAWKDQGGRIAALKGQVTKGQMMLDREKNLNDRWAGMMHANPAGDDSAAEDVAFKAVARWERDSRVSFTSLTKQKNWENHDDMLDSSRKTIVSYKTLEFRISVTGDQASLGRFLYEMENDAIPVNLEACEISTRDARGSQLTLAATFSFLQIPKENP